MTLCQFVKKINGTVSMGEWNFYKKKKKRWEEEEEEADVLRTAVHCQNWLALFMVV